MTVMDPRPWSPAGPHIGPDDEDLALLEGTGDAEADLGSAVLVVHRVGGAAAEAVARAPLPDEYRLIEALATAREALAPRAVEVVGKCLGREDAYADLLLRDLFDAGEQGALAVYRACVSKGVPPPLAVQRAGLVYGVPQGDLGRYLSVAADPRAHPVAIADAADRVIAKWASGVVRDEIAEPVSKRSVLEYNQTQVGHEHPKGQAGRFVTTMERPSTVAEAAVSARPAAGRVAGQPVGVLAGLRRNGIGAQVAPEVAGAPVTVAAPPPPTRAERKVRPTRQTRKTRDQDQIKSQLRGSLSAKLNSRLTSSLSSKTQARLNAQAARKSAFEDVDVAAPVQPTGQVFGKIPNDLMLAWGMRSSEADDLWWNANGVAGGREMVMGNLLNTLNEPYRWQTFDHTGMMDRAARGESSEQLRTHKIPGWELEEAGVDVYNGTPREIAMRVREYAAKAGYSSGLIVDPERGTQHLEQLANQDVAPSADAVPGELTDWYVIQKPRETGGMYEDEIETVPLPVAAEFVLDSDRSDIRGNLISARAGVELDPTQKVVAKEKVTLWRDAPGGGYFVERYTLVGVDDDVEKAVGVLERERTSWQTEARDDHGRWTSRGVLAPVMQRQDERLEVPATAPPLPQARTTRATRAVRAQRGDDAVQGRVRAGISPRMVARVDPKVESVMQAVVKEIAEEEAAARPEPTQAPRVLDDRHVHKLLTQDELHSIFKAYPSLENRFLHDAIKPVYKLPTLAKAELLTHDNLTGEDVNSVMRLQLLGEMNTKSGLREIGGFATQLELDETGKPSKAEVRDLYGKMRNYMATHPEAQYMQVGKNRATDPEGFVRVYRNAQELTPQVLIYMQDDLNMDEPAQLRYLGKASQLDLNRGRWMYWPEEEPVNAPVQIYRFEKAMYTYEQSPRDE